LDMDRKFHAAANLFPLLQGEAFKELVADIRHHGLREPILVDDEGPILDGRNRYRACLEAGVKPRFVKSHEESPAELSLSLNLHRRHLSTSQRALVAARLAALLAPNALKRKGQRSDLKAILPSGQSGSSRSKAASMVNVSPRLVTQALKLLRAGRADLIASVESGVMSVSRAAASVAPRRVEPPDTDSKLDAGKSYVLWVNSGRVDQALDALKSAGFRQVK